MRSLTILRLAVFAGSLTAGCQRPQPDAERRAQVARDTKQIISIQIATWKEAAVALYAAAPVPSGRGFEPKQDAQAVEAMKAAWHRARTAYELIEGALAPLFPESDLATDARYDDFLANLGPVGDPRPFDAEGVIGMHAIERVLWADQVPADVVAFEKGLPGYRPAAFPSNEEEARAFKEQLVLRMRKDIEKLEGEFAPLELDLAFAFRGLVDLAAEQFEKVDRAATGQEESRYAQATMKDLRANRQGCLAAYRAFQPWVLERTGGAELDRSVLAAFERLRVAYDAIPGDAIPRPPSDWSTVAPSEAQRATPFGRLQGVVQRECNEREPGSLLAGLHAVADLLELPKMVTR